MPPRPGSSISGDTALGCNKLWGPQGPVPLGKLSLCHQSRLGRATQHCHQALWVPVPVLGAV